MLDPALDVADAAASIALVPGAIELFRRCPELHDQIARQVRGIGLAAFLAPQPHQCGSLITHDDSGVRASDERTSILHIAFPESYQERYSRSWPKRCQYLRD